MWISETEYNELLDRICAAKKNEEEWKAKYNAVANDETTVFHDCVVLSYSEYWQLHGDAYKAGRRVKELQEEITKLKQIYADEVQRRYELASLMRGQPDV